MAKVMQIFGPALEGEAANEAAKFEAKQMEAQGKAVEAQGLRRGASVRRTTLGILGDMRAAQAGSGGSTSDAGAIKQQAKMKDRGEFNALAAIFGGSEQNEALKLQAKGARFGGKVARNAGIMKSIGEADKAFEAWNTAPAGGG